MKIKLLVLDIDGVMTDGTKVYDLNGDVIAKSFHDHDFSAIKRFLNDGVTVIFLSKDDRVNQKMAENRNIQFIHVQKDTNKFEYLSGLLEDHWCNTWDIAYVGDDIHDIELLKSVKYGFCPADAVKEVKDVAYVLPRKSGSGVISELYDWYQETNT
tara:strand:+ start:323 stop:790 length:468 start_codon:yes stop_codon:yes gene_type:complete